jgi:monoamine oxidase
MSSEAEVIVVGAGLAGLGAATALRQAGHACVVLEAAGRIGGRAWTTHPGVLDGAWFDMGAFWLHDAAHNPLVPLAEARGLRLFHSDALRRELTFVDGRPARPADLAAYEAAWPRFEAAADALIARQGDVSMAEVRRHLADDPWAATVDAWESPIICTADSERFSARDWRRNALGGYNLVPDGGIGAFVAGWLGEGLDIRLHTPVRRVRWGGPGGRVTVETDRGSLTARAAIVTVSTGVLGSGALAFDPALPDQTQAAIAALPMGMAIKVAVPARGPDRLGLPDHCSVDRQVGREGDHLVPLQFWPLGRRYVQAWIGGPPAWVLAREGDAAVIDHVIGQIGDLFGHQAATLFDTRSAWLTHWDADPWVLGAYCFAIPRHAEARDRLAEPVADGHLLFAGEGCHVPYAGTVAGAWLSGRDAALRLAGGVLRASAQAG